MKHSRAGICVPYHDAILRALASGAGTRNLPRRAEVRRSIAKQAGDIVTVRLDRRLND